MKLLPLSAPIIPHQNETRIQRRFLKGEHSTSIINLHMQVCLKP
jgi:hypothetical protein